MKHVVDRFHHRLPKDELKKFAREVNKKLVASDYKNRRVEDPTSISSKQAKKVRKYAHDFFERAVVKFTDHEKKKAPSGAGKPVDAGTPSQPGEAPSAATTPIEVDISPSSSPGGRKRKRDAADADDDRLDSPEAPPSETPSVKRIKEDDDAVEGEDTHPSPPPPPPPPPPVETPPTDEERSMREQEEALMRENEEAQRLEDEARANHHEGTGGGRNGLAGGLMNGGGSEMDVDVDMTQQQQAQKQAVLSH